ncbi:uncharacterized protein TNCV_2298181 [Trichonephila clavipes]|nr:uncharacterized protein TNCV_2298181 [Trichonephila clavipes]
MATIDFLHHENPPTWGGVEPAALDAEACRKFEPGAAEDPPYKGGCCKLNLSGLKRPPIGLVWKLGEGVACSEETTLLHRTFDYAAYPSCPFVNDCKPSSVHTVPKLIWCGSWGCNLGQSLSNHGLHVFYRRKIRRASRPGKQFNLVIDEEPLDNACHVWSRIILLKYGCGQAVKVRKDNWLQHLEDVALAA